jgi:predicted lactoylglutathione lyase
MPSSPFAARPGTPRERQRDRDRGTTACRRETAMIGYVTLGTNDMARATAFYDRLLGSIGARRVFESPTGIGWGTSATSPSLAVMKPFDGKAATVGNGTMVAFAVDASAKVDALYKLALELGGKDEGPPGPRGDGFYAAYFRDLDGNKLNAFFMG